MEKGGCMTRNEAIEHWKPIIKAVFVAEESISDAWQQKLKEAANLSPDEQIRFLDTYLSAVAEEILKATTDDELTYM